MLLLHIWPSELCTCEGHRLDYIALRQSRHAQAFTGTACVGQRRKGLAAMTAFHLRGASPYFDSDLLSGHQDNPSRRKAPSWAGALGRMVSGWIAHLAEYFHRHQVMAELYRLSDRELADIGLTRSEIHLIYSEEFAARRRAEQRD